jgi:amino acid adenylation domain-containing protein
MNAHSGLEDVLPLSPLQEGMLFHHLYDQRALDVYTAQVQMELDGMVDAAAMREAVRHLLHRHANLRAAFRQEGLSQPVQVIPRTATVPWREVDLTGLSGAEQAARAEREQHADRWQRFDLTRSPLLRCTLLRFGPLRYRFVLTNHHLLFDGWSRPIVLRDLVQLYLDPAGADRLPPPPRYRDFLAWLAARDRAAARAAWTTALADLPGPTLVAAVPGPMSTAPARVDFAPDAGTGAALAAIASANGLTLNTVVQGAWVLVLAQLTGRDDVVFGMTVSGRPPELSGVDTMVGLFINTLPVRVRIDPREPVTTLLGRVQREQAGLLDHHWVGLADIQRWAGSPGDLFDTAVVFENYPSMGTASANGGPSSPRIRDVRTNDAAHYALTMLAVPKPPLRFSLGYRPEVFDHTDAERIAAHFGRALRAIADDPQCPVGRIDVFDAADRRRALGPPDTSESRVDGVTLPELFERQAAKRGKWPAATDARTTLTYAELDTRANQLARHLIARGAGPERVVAVVLPRSVDLVIAALAVVKSGAAYLPVDPDYPAERIATMLDDAKPVCTLRAIPDLAGVSGAPLAGAERHHPLEPRHPAYVIYTSGSTGTPKGVVIEHRAICAFLDRTRRDYPGLTGLGLLHSSISFDQSVGAMFLPLVSGGGLRLTELDERAVPGTAFRRASFMKATPSHLPLLLALPDEVSPSRAITFGGEALLGEALRPWRERHPDTTVFNVYGPTETTVHCVDFRLEPGAEIPDGPVPLGKPNAITRLYLLDPVLRPVPPGVPGEIYLAGPQLGRGYLHRTALTAERFVADPFGSPGGRMYRSGDLARWTGGGELDFLGRADQQVKVRGFRVELGEVEAALVADRAVAQAAVVIREDQPGDPRITAYLVPAEGGCDPGQVRTRLTQVLPDYMVPAAVVLLDALPLTPNGKLDRRALPAPPQTGTPDARAPRTPSEEILCGLFADVLGRAAVGVDEDFFELGGHSLLAMRLISRVRTALRAELAIRALFETPTVTGLARRIEQQADGPARPPLRPADRPDVVPLSYAQQRLWFLAQLEQSSATYHIPMALRLRGRLDADALAAALADLVGRHESLRTVFPQIDGQPRQVVLDPARVPPRIEVVNISEVADVGEAGLSATLARWSRLPFDLATEIPIRAVLCRLASDAHVLLLVVHHIASDAWSRGPLVRDLTTAYAARAHGESPQWSPLPVQYPDYALWQRELMGREEEQLRYWRTALAELPEQIQLPLDRRRPPVPSHQGGSVPVRVPAEVHREVVRLARRRNASPFMVLQAALAALLHRLGAGTDIPIGAPIAGRTDQALDDLIGFFVNTLVLRCDVSGDPTFGALLARVRETNLAAYAHQDLPFERLVEVLNPTRSLAWNPLFQVTISLLQPDRSRLRLPGLIAEGMPAGDSMAKFDLSLSLVEHLDEGSAAAGLTGTMDFATDLFEPATVEAMARRYVDLLGQVVAAPDLPVGRLTMLDERERHQVLVEWNDTAIPAAPDGTIPALFAATRNRVPGEVALVCGDQTLTYAELDARANGVAWRLAEHGVCPEENVAVLMRRSADLVVVLLGILKAGAAYVPLDSRQPMPRMARVIGDTGARVIVSDGADPDRDRRLSADAGAALLVVPHDRDRARADAPPVTVRPEHLAYIMFTSGSTGRPKGVAVTHRNVVGLAADGIWTGGNHARVLAHSPHSFDASTYELWVPLLSGGQAVVAPDADADPAVIADLVDKHGVTAAFLTTALFNLVVDGHPGALAGLREVWTGGEAVDPAAIARALDACPGTVVSHVYGPTETTTFATYHALRGPLPDDGIVPIGRPMDNTRGYVLDDRLRPVPPGVPGELYLAADGLARGYLKRPALTAERFVAAPFGEPGERVYRTGDLVRWNTAGQIEFIGRVDTQVKIRGFRIEPGEIEAVLARHPSVARAVVTVREDRPGEKRLVAYFVPADAADPVDAARLRGHVAGLLPEYMVPAAFMALDALPMTTNGKLDRAALPAPSYQAGPGRPPGTAEEEILCELFAEVLGVDRVGVDDAFFDLGGHSLLAVRLAGRIRETLGVQLAVSDVFAAPTVAALAAHLGGGARRRDPFAGLLPLRTRGDQPPLFCVHPGSGMSWCYTGLVRYLPPDYPVYGLQARGLTGDEPHAGSIEEMAADYVARIRWVQPHGPYRLLGWSLGGKAAVMMASLLREEGERVELLAVLDSYPRTVDAHAGYLPPEEVIARNLRADGFDVDAAELAGGALPMDRYRAHLRATGDPMSSLDDGELVAVGRTLMNNIVILRQFVPPRVDADLVLFAAVHGGRLQDAQTWRQYVTGAIESYPVDTDHARMVTSDAALARIGGVLAEKLSNIQESQPQPQPRGAAR